MKISVVVPAKAGTHWWTTMDSPFRGNDESGSDFQESRRQRGISHCSELGSGGSCVSACADARLFREPQPNYGFKEEDAMEILGKVLLMPFWEAPAMGSGRPPLPSLKGPL